VKHRFLHDRRGQNLVLLAVLMTVLLGVLAIAIDAGRLYLERRRMQNAADAAALAGAQELCFGSGQQGPAEAIARDYATNRNGAQAAAIEWVDRWTIRVVASETVGNFFAGAIGVQTSDVSARATAACGSSTAGCRLWPVAIDSTKWDGLGCGQTFYVWNDNADNPLRCGSSCPCDTDGDGFDDVLDMDGRSWLDFSAAMLTDNALPTPACRGEGCGNELGCWITNDNPGVVRLPACIAGLNGTYTIPRDNVEFRAGDVVRIPLFQSGPTGPASCQTSAARGSCSGPEYWITGLGCARVAALSDEPWVEDFLLYAPTPTPPPAPTPAPTPSGPQVCWRGKVIKLGIECADAACYVECGSTSGGGPVDGGLNTVSLID
jgi:Flp pilus assembly protein TadG